jgi:serine/threonine protein kinase/tetratricopeptide (TPR) repeat protein
MGVVHRAIDERDGRVVALKTLLDVSPALGAAMRREVAALRALAHPSVVRIHDYGSSEAGPWFAMELLEGTTLRQQLGAGNAVPTFSVLTSASRLGIQETAELSGTQLSQLAGRAEPGVPTGQLEESVRIMAEICDGLAYVHSAGLIHGDLKPENIFLRSAQTAVDGRRAVLVDFGLAARLLGSVEVEDLETAGLRAGTMAYIAPERLSGTHYDPRSDLYAVGCMLYELLSGSPPFLGSLPQIIAGHLTSTPRPLNRVGREGGLARLAMSLLAKSPAERPRSAAVVLHRLRRLGFDTPEPVEPPRPWLFRPTLSDRRDERAELTNTLADLGSRGHVWLVIGEPGIGKSRFAMEVVRVARSAGVAVAVSGAVAGGGAMSAIAGLFPGGPPAPTLTGMHPRDARAARLRVTSEALTQAHPHGAVLVVENVHRADDLSLAWFEELARHSQAGKGQLMLLTARASESAELAERLQQAGARVSELNPLPARDLRELLRNTLACQDPIPAVENAICARAGGSPFVATELLRSLVHRGVLDTGADGDWFLRSTDIGDALELPASVRESVIERLTSLDQAARQLCDAACVLQGRFSLELLAGLLSTSTAEIESLLGQLRPHSLFEEHDGQLVFAQEYIREVLLEALDCTTRENLHTRAAQQLEAVSSPPHTQIARHWQAAGQLAAARDSFVSAARFALDHHALRDAASLFGEALALTDPGVDRTRMQFEQLEVRLLLGRDEQLLDEVRQTAEESVHFDDRELEARAWTLYATCSEEYDNLCRHAAEAAKRGNHTLALSGALRAWALLIWQDDKPHEALRMLTQAASLLEGQNAEDDMARCLVNIGLAHHDLGQRPQARDCAERALAVFKSRGARYAEAACVNNLALLDQEEGQYESARERFLAVASLHAGLGTIEREALALANAAHTEHALGRFDAACRHVDRAIEIFTQLELERLLVWAHREAAALHLDRGDLDACQAHLDGALACSSPGALPSEVPYIQARLALARGNRDGARSAITRFLWPNPRVESRALHALLALELDPTPTTLQAAMAAVDEAGHMQLRARLIYLELALGLGTVETALEMVATPSCTAVERGLIAAHLGRTRPEDPDRESWLALWRDVVDSLGALAGSALVNADPTVDSIRP